MDNRPLALKTGPREPIVLPRHIFFFSFLFVALRKVCVCAMREVAPRAIDVAMRALHVSQECSNNNAFFFSMFCSYQVCKRDQVREI